jgi:hypothetical protein
MSISKPINIRKVNNNIDYLMDNIDLDNIDLIDNLSCSILIDYKKDFGTTPPEKDFIQSKLHTIYPISNDKWIDSNIIIKCQSCLASFGFFVRKHHCRACGKVFCSNCCYKSIKIPQNFINKPKEDNTISQSINNTFKWFTNNKDDLVCNECYDKISKLNKITDLIKICEFLDFQSLNMVIVVSKDWYNASIHQLSKFREIQYIDPHKLLSNWQKNIIWFSKELFYGHNIIIIIKSGLQMFYEKSDNKILKEIYKLINNQDKVISCKKAMCSRKCNIGYDVLDFLEILKYISILESNKQLLWYSKELQTLLIIFLKYIYSIESHLNLTEDLKEKNKYVIPLFCSTLCFLSNTKKDRINLNFIYQIFDTIFKDEIKIKNLALELNYIETLNNTDLGVMNFIGFTNYYIRQKNLDIEKNIQTMKLTLNQIYKNSKKSLEVTLDDPILYPLDLSYKITKITKIDKINSNTSPLLIHAIITNDENENKNVKFIIKKDKWLRKERIVSCLITLLQDRIYQQALRKRIQIFDKIPTYQIIVLTSEIGVIEFVENSLTLRMVQKSGLTLQNYILENNLTELIDTTKRRFMQSLAISCCISYILGLGDRHLDNIMINKKGQLFHIDYGYLMDNPLTSILTSPNIKITPVMIDFLGGTEGLYYKEFTEYIIKIYDIMRLYKNLIINYYKMLDDEKFVDWKIFKEKLEGRFLSGLQWKDIQITLINELETSNLTEFGDLCHNTKQSFFDVFF